MGVEGWYFALGQLSNTYTKSSFLYENFAHLAFRLGQKVQMAMKKGPAIQATPLVEECFFEKESSKAKQSKVKQSNPAGAPLSRKVQGRSDWCGRWCHKLVPHNADDTHALP